MTSSLSSSYFQNSNSSLFQSSVSSSAPFTLVFDDKEVLSESGSQDAMEGVEVVGARTTANKYRTHSNLNSTKSVFSSSSDGCNSNQQSHNVPIGTWMHAQTGRVVQGLVFKRTKLGLILINSIVLAVQTLPWTRSQDFVYSILTRSSWAFCYIFIFSLLLEIAHYQLHFFTLGWLLFDTFIMATVMLTNEPVYTMFCSFRLLRALRKASCCDRLQFAVQSFLRVMPYILSLSVLLTAIVFIFAVVFTELLQDDFDTTLFVRLDASMLTLFQIMTLDSWSEIANQLASSQPSLFVWFFFAAFLLVTTVVFSCLAVAVACQVVTHVHEERYWQPLASYGGGGGGGGTKKTANSSTATTFRKGATHSSNYKKDSSIQSFEMLDQSQSIHFFAEDDASCSARDLYQYQSVRRLEHKLQELTSIIERLVNAQQFEQSMPGTRKQLHTQKLATILSADGGDDNQSDTTSDASISESQKSEALQALSTASTPDCSEETRMTRNRSSNVVKSVSQNQPQPLSPKRFSDFQVR